MSEAQRILAFLVLSGVAAIALRAVSRRARIPYPVVLAVGGILLGLIPGGGVHVVGPDLILLAFVPGLVFSAAFTLHLGQLRRVIQPVALLATVGVSAVVLGFGAACHAAIGLSWSDAFILGAILAPTDPIAVVRVLRVIRAPAAITALLEGESLLNDGTGVAIFGALIASVGAGVPSALDVGLRFLEITGIGAGVGAASGALAVLVLRATEEPSLEFLTTLTVAYGAYLGADLVHGSGIVAVVTAAFAIVVFRNRLHLHSERLLEFWDVTSFILNAVLFLLIGAALPTRAVVESLGAVVVAFVLLAVTRGIMVVPIMTLGDLRSRRFPWPLQGFVIWAGLRGALSVALALSLRSGHGIGGSVATIAYGVVVLTLLVQGSTVRPLANMLRLADRGVG